MIRVATRKGKALSIKRSLITGHFSIFRSTKVILTMVVCREQSCNSDDNFAASYRKTSWTFKRIPD